MGQSEIGLRWETRELSRAFRLLGAEERSEIERGERGCPAESDVIGVPRANVDQSD